MIAGENANQLADLLGMLKGSITNINAALIVGI